MIAKKKSINPINSREVLRSTLDKENSLVRKGINKEQFYKFVNSFWSEKEDKKRILSWFLSSSNKNLEHLWNIKIDINHIKNYIWNKPDISKSLEKKIAKLYLQKLYESWATNIPFVTSIKSAFDIENKADIENKNIDFETIQSNINKLSPDWDENINSVIISNNEIFDLLDVKLDKNSNFESQDLESKDKILDLLQFEVKWVIDYVKSHWKKMEKDMENIALPINDFSNLFDEIKDPEISDLQQEKEEIEEQLFSNENADNAELERKKELLNKQIRQKYIENFEKEWKNPEFVTILKKLFSNDFDFSKLDKKEQTILWQTLVTSKFDKNENSRAKFSWIDLEEFKSFLKEVYDFEKEETTIDIQWVWLLKLHIKKDVQWWKNKMLQDTDRFEDMDKTNPIKFIVNIDDNDKEIIKDLEETKDSPLRADWIMETHITSWWELNIWNWYKLEICGKTITKSQLDELLECDYDQDELNTKLKDFWLYDELKDQVISVKKKMFNPENVYYDFDENGVAKNNDQWYWPYWYKFCIFKEILKDLDVKVVERNLILEWKSTNKLSQLYIISKLWSNEEETKSEALNERQDKKIDKLLNENLQEDTKKELSNILDADRESEDDSAEKEAGETYAETLFERIKNIYTIYDGDTSAQDTQFTDYLQDLDEDDWVSKMAEEFWNELHRKWKSAFKKKLQDLAKEEEKNSDGIQDAVSQILSDLGKKEEKYDAKKAKKAEKDLWIEFEAWTEKTEYAEFLDEWKKLSWDKSIETIEKWVRLYLDLWETQLQPKDISDAIRSYFCFEVTNVDIENWKFTIKWIWWDLKSSLVGEDFTLNMTAKQLKRMKDWWDVFRVKARKSVDWNSCLDSINNAWFFKEITAFGTMEWQVRLNWSKFVNEKWEEIKYFDRVEWIFDDSKEKVKDRWQWQKIYKYEIKNIDTSRWMVKIASTFDDFDENGEQVKYAYENDMTFEQFILLMEWKRLKWYTESQQKEMETKYTINDPKRLPTKWMRKRVSIWAIINVFKNTTKTIKWKIEERRKDQEEDLENYLFSQEWLNIYGKIGDLFGNSTIWDSARKLQYEFYTNRENRTWKRIEEWYKIFQADPNYSELYKEQLIPILNKPWYRGTSKDRYKFAAAFLMMVKKEWPCPRDFTKEIWKWNWVEKFLWPEHKVRFLNFYQKKKNELEQVKDMWHKKDVRLDLQEELNKLEYMYIINTIEWNAPHGPESNEFMLKSIWSINFSKELRANIDGYFEKHNETKKEMKTFYAAEEQYLRTVWAGRFNKAVPSLERMLELANTPWEVFRAKWYLLAAMLTWIIKNNSTKDTLKSFWKTARTIWFAPWYRVIDTEAQDKVKIMLDWVTNWEFSKTQWLNLEKYNPWNLQDGNYEFLKKFQWYWNGNGRKILDKVENPSYKKKDDPEDKSVIDLSKDENNPNSYVFKEIIKNSTTNEIDWTNPDVNSKALYQKESPLSATSNTMNKFIPNRAQYSRVEKEEDKSDAESFWQSVIDKKCIPSWLSSKETTDFLFEKYFNRFNTILPERKDKIVRSIPLIQEMKKNGEHDVAKYMLRYMIKWTIHKVTWGTFPTEFETVMNKFYEFFFDNIEFIDKSTIKQTFKGDNEIIKGFDDPYKMFNWKEYNRYKMNNLSGSNSSTRSRYTKLMNYEIRKINFQNRHIEGYQEIGENDFINKHIELIWKDCDKYWVAPGANIWSSNSWIKLNVLWETNDTINKKIDKLDKLEEYYDSLAA